MDHVFTLRDTLASLGVEEAVIDDHVDKAKVSQE